jgi:hypothetical protein
MVIGFFYWETLIPVDKAAMYVIKEASTAYRILANLVPDHPGHGFITISPFFFPSRSYHTYGGAQCSRFLPPYGRTYLSGRSYHRLCTCKVFDVTSCCPSLKMFSHTRFPIGITAFAMSFTGSLSRIFSPKWIILTGLSLCMAATVLLALGGGKPQDYWLYIFPAFSLGSAGVMLTYTHTK